MGRNLREDCHAATSDVVCTVREQVEELASAVSVLTLGRLVLFPPEAACVERVFADLPVSGRLTLPRLRRSSRPILGCMDPESLRLAVVLSVLKMNERECVVDAWQGLLTAEPVASSLAYGDLLDDLPADVVEDMASAAAVCGPDRQWWIEDVIFHDELQLELSDQERECVAARYLDVMGVEEVIRRRLLNAPLLAVPPEDEARLDMSGQCTVTKSGTLKLLHRGRRRLRRGRPCRHRCGRRDSLRSNPRRRGLRRP